MARVRKRVLVFTLLLAPALLGLTAYWFIPRLEVPRAEELPDGDLVPHAFAQVRDGGADHPASGNVTLYLDNETNSWFLYFQGYKADRGHDVRFFLTPDPDPKTRDHVELGIQLTVPGRGPADTRGDFVVPIPDDADPLKSSGLVAWDLRFNQRYAVATLQPVRTV